MLPDAEAVERPPGQQRLRDLVDAVMQLKGDKAERLLATARELAEEPDEAAYSRSGVG